MRRIGFLLMAILLFVGIQTSKAGVNVDSLKNELKKEIIKSSKEIQDQKKDSILYSKLSADQIKDLKDTELDNRRREIEKEGRSEMPLNGFGVVIICMLPFLFAGTIIVVNVRAKKEESKRKYDLYAKSLEMGQTVPEHFFDEPKKVNPSSNLKRGILWLVIGLGLVISFLVIHEKDGLILGIVPAFVGVGYLLVHFLEKPTAESTVNNDEQHG